MNSARIGSAASTSRTGGASAAVDSCRRTRCAATVRRSARRSSPRRSTTASSSSATIRVSPERLTGRTSRDCAERTTTPGPGEVSDARSHPSSRAEPDCPRSSGRSGGDRVLPRPTPGGAVGVEAPRWARSQPASRPRIDGRARESTLSDRRRRGAAGRSRLSDGLCGRLRGRVYPNCHRTRAHLRGGGGQNTRAGARAADPAMSIFCARVFGGGVRRIVAGSRRGGGGPGG